MLDMKSPDTIQAVIVYNPLETSDRTEAELAFQPGKSLTTYLDGLPKDVEWSVSLNGVIIPEDGLAFTFPKPGDSLIVTPVPEGGSGDGKAILALVATVALSIFAPYAGAALAKSMGMAGSKLATAMATAGVQIAGGMLISAMIPPPEAPSSSKDDNYGIDGPKNTNSEGVPFPVLYGEHAVGGNFIDIYTENTTDENGKSIQYLYARTLVSEGPIDSIDQVFINDQPAENYENVEIDYRLGYDEQTISPWFNKTISLHNQNKELTTGWQTYTTSEEVDEIRVDLGAAAGIVRHDSKGRARHVTVECDLEYAPAGSNDWRAIQSETPWIESPSGLFSILSGNPARVTDAVSIKAKVVLTQLFSRGHGAFDISVKYRRKTPAGWGSWVEMDRFTGDTSTAQHEYEAVVHGLDEDQYEVSIFDNIDPQAGTENSALRFLKVSYKRKSPVKLRDNSSKTIRRTFSSGSIEEGVYDVRFRRKSEPSTSDKVQDKVIVTDIGEIKAEPLTLPYTAWLGVKIKLTGQLNGIPTITAIAKGRILPIYDHNGELVDYRYSNNPADVALDAYTHMRYGGQLEPERIDFAAFAEWREFCDENDLTFNNPFFDITNIDDALKGVYIAGRAQRISSGAKLSVAIDRPESPTMMFSDGNIKSGSMEISYLPFADRVNDLEIAFYDKDDLYKRKAVRVTNDLALNRGEPLKSSVIELKGITERQRALREGTLRMNYNRMVKRTATWESPLEAVSCAVGDVVIVQHKMPGWGKGGRLLPSSSVSELVLDQEVTFTPGQNYRVLVHQNAKSHANNVTIQSQTGNMVTIDQPINPEWTVNRLTSQSHGIDLGITRIVDETTLLLEGRATDMSLANLTSMSLVQTDYIEDVDVANPAVNDSVTTDRIEPVSDLSNTPDQYPNFIFGAVQFTKKPFRVKTITRSADSQVSLTAVEYIEEVYDDDPQARPHNYTSLVSTDHVTDLSIEELIVQRGQINVSYVRAQWEQAESGVYTGAKVQMSRNGLPYQTIGETSDTSYEFQVEQGDRILVRVLPSVFGTDVTVEPGLAPVASLTIEGVTEPSPAPTGWTGEPGVRLVTLSGPEPVDDSAFSHFEVYGDIADGTFETSSLVARSSSSVIQIAVPFTSDMARYWVIEVDTAGNKSAPSDYIDVRPTGVIERELDTTVADKINETKEKADKVREDHDTLIEGFTKTSLGELEVDYDATNTAAEQAQNARTAAESARDSSLSYRDAAQSAQNAAETARDEAQTSATNASGSASASAGHASNASASETSAGDSATAASAAQVSAEAARDDASGHASAAAQSASAASASETAAGQSAAASETSHLAAETARGGAEIAENNAAVSATDAAGSASTALRENSLSSISVDSAILAARDGNAAGTGAVRRSGNGNFAQGWTGWATIPGLTTDVHTLEGVTTGLMNGDDSQTIASIDLDLELTQIIRAGDAAIEGA